MLTDELRKRALEASKARDTVATTIFRLALGEVQTLEARLGREPTADEALAQVRKLVKSNEETLGATTDEEKKSILVRETALLRELLPQGPSVADVSAALATVAEGIKAAPNDGAATGVAMKHLKSVHLAADGKTVAAAVKTIRGGA
jgi:uncharacterized protein YqeY